MTKGCVVIWWLLTSLAAIDWVFETSGIKYHKKCQERRPGNLKLELDSAYRPRCPRSTFVVAWKLTKQEG